jgi:hypothetical protein
VVSVTAQPLATPGKDSVPIAQEAGWTPGPVWTSAENLAPTGILSPDRPARSQLLYRVGPPTGCFIYVILTNMWNRTHNTATLVTKSANIKQFYPP